MPQQILFLVMLGCSFQMCAVINFNTSFIASHSTSATGYYRHIISSDISGCFMYTPCLYCRDGIGLTQEKPAGALTYSVFFNQKSITIRGVPSLTGTMTGAPVSHPDFYIVSRSLILTQG